MLVLHLWSYSLQKQFQDTETISLNRVEMDHFYARVNLNVYTRKVSEMYVSTFSRAMNSNGILLNLLHSVLSLLTRFRNLWMQDKCSIEALFFKGQRSQSQIWKKIRFPKQRANRTPQEKLWRTANPGLHLSNLYLTSTSQKNTLKEIKVNVLLHPQRHHGSPKNQPTRRKFPKRTVRHQLQARVKPDLPVLWIFLIFCCWRNPSGLTRPLLEGSPDFFFFCWFSAGGNL